jgi:hypothetical protein
MAALAETLTPALVEVPGTAGACTLDIAGMTVHVDTYLGHEARDGGNGGGGGAHLYAVSLLGPSVAVRAAVAALVARKAGILRDGARTMPRTRWERHPTARWAGERREVTEQVVCTLRAELHWEVGKWKVYQAALPAAGGVQALVLPETAFVDSPRHWFVLLCRPDDDPATRYYQQLAARSKIPLHPLWRDALWQRALLQGVAVPLAGRGFVHGWRCTTVDHALGQWVSQGLRDRRLPVPGGEEVTDGRDGGGDGRPAPGGDRRVGVPGAH